MEAFELFGGVFGAVRYDNLGSAVKQVLQGPPARRDRPLRRAALALSCSSRSSRSSGLRARTRRAASRARSAASAATISSRSRRSRRSAELNARLRAGCEHDLARRIAGHPVTVGEALGARAAAAARAARRAAADAPSTVTPRVDAKALVTVRQNRYSVPVALVGLRVDARIGARRSRSAHGGRAGRLP